MLSVGLPTEPSWLPKWKMWLSSLKRNNTSGTSWAPIIILKFRVFQLPPTFRFQIICFDCGTMRPSETNMEPTYQKMDPRKRRSLQIWKPSFVFIYIISIHFQLPAVSFFGGAGRCRLSLLWAPWVPSLFFHSLEVHRLSHPLPKVSLLRCFGRFWNLFGPWKLYIIVVFDYI